MMQAQVEAPAVVDAQESHGGGSCSSWSTLEGRDPTASSNGLPGFDSLPGTMSSCDAINFRTSSMQLLHETQQQRPTGIVTVHPANEESCGLWEASEGCFLASDGRHRVHAAGPIAEARIAPAPPQAPETCFAVCFI